MKAVFEKNALVAGVTPALSSVSGRNTMPAIEGVNLRCEEPGKCVITSYDLEKGFRTTIECEVSEPGSIVINGQKLCQVVRTMPGDFITLEIAKNGVAAISSGNSRFELPAIDGKDFPSLPDLNGDRGFEISQSVFSAMLDQVMFAIAQNNMRPELNGAYFVTDGSKLTIVSCDGNKLAFTERALPIRDFKHDNAAMDEKFIVPGRTLADVQKAISDVDEPMYIKMTLKHVIFNVGELIFFTRIIDTKYIDYKRFIPLDGNIFVKLDSDSLVGALERAMLVTEDRALGQAKSPLKCKFVGNKLIVNSTSVTGRVEDEIFTEKIGDDIEIGFNCRYLLDAMRACRSERVQLTLKGPLMSMIIRPAEDDPDNHFLFMVLPVKMVR